MRSDERVKIGERLDVVKGTEYEMNLILRFFNENGAWGYETTRVQGALSNLFLVGKRGKQIPYKDLFAYASSIKPVALKDKSEADLASEQVDDANHTKEELIAYGKEKGLAVSNGIKQFSPNTFSTAHNCGIHKWELAAFFNELVNG